MKSYIVHAKIPATTNRKGFQTSTGILANSREDAIDEMAIMWPEATEIKVVRQVPERLPS